MNKELIASPQNDHPKALGSEISDEIDQEINSSLYGTPQQIYVSLPSLRRF